MSAAPRLRGRVVAGWERARGDWGRLAAGGVPTPFQSLAWLDEWHAAFAGEVEPCTLFVADEASDRDICALALARRREGRRRVIEFADLGLTDYNAPLLGEAAPEHPAFAAALWRAARAALPDADLLRLEKMPRRLGARANPLALADGVAASRLEGNVLTMDGAWEDWRRGLDRVVRKEFERSWRVFERYPGARFRRVREAGEAARTLGELARMQRARIAALGLPYALDAPRASGFYERLVAARVASGEVVLTCLEAEGECVAALLGVAHGDHYAMVRLGQAGGRWSHVSPGRLMIDQTMRALRAEGFRIFDFTTGAYDYKRRMKVETLELCELVAPLSLRGVAPWGAARMKAAMRRSPVVVGAVQSARTLLRSSRGMSERPGDAA